MRTAVCIALGASTLCAAVAAWAEGTCWARTTTDPCGLMSEPPDGCPDSYNWGNSCPWVMTSTSGWQQQLPVPGNCIYNPQVFHNGQCQYLGWQTYTVTCVFAGGDPCP